MQRREFLKNSAAIMGGLAIMPFDQFKILRHSSKEEIFKIKIGPWDCTILKDFTFKYLAKDFFINANEDELKQSLDRYHIVPDNIPSPFIALLLQKDGQRILVDTGGGFSQNPIEFRGRLITLKGRLQQLLQIENIKTEDVTDVIITHFHPDHIGGIFSENGQLNFPNAKFHMHEDEWNYWHSSKADSQPEMFHYFISKNITPLKERNLQLVKGGSMDIVAGITAIKAEGHTPGQMALSIQSPGDNLLYISDAFLHPLHMEKLGWQTNYDMDHDKARQSRIKLLEMAYKENMLINAFHFDFPGLGRIDKFNGNWRWNYLNN